MVKQDNEGVPVVERSFIYHWLSGFFARELESEVLTFYGTAEGMAFLDTLAANRVFLPLVCAIRDIVEDENALHDRILDLKSTFARLFLGVGGLRSASPYHSAYASNKGLLFQSQMMEMSDILRELDMSVVNTLKEPPDHIAVQLNVLAELADRMALNSIEESPAARAQAVRRQIIFMDNHLLSWLPAFCEDCVAYDSSQFYGLAAGATLAFVEQEREKMSADLPAKI